MDKLKCYPFCGGEALMSICDPSTAKFNEGAVHFKASCKSIDCIATSLNTWQISPEDAATAWNKRIIDNKEGK